MSFTPESMKIPGDPETEVDFTRAFSYLETITAHFQEFGPIEEKTPWDVVYELSYHNAWYQHEIEVERRAGEKQAEYREISLEQLHALSKRRLLAMAEAGRVDEASAFIDRLIEQAVAEEEAFEKLITPAPAEPPV